MKAAVLLAGMLFMGATTIASAQVVYKWVDDEGVTTFGTNPPFGVDAERTSTRIHPTNPRTLQTSMDSSAKSYDATVARIQKKNEQADDNKAGARKERTTRAETCAKARERAEKYNTSRRLYRKTDDGGREYLDDDELTSERENADKLVEQWCD